MLSPEQYRDREVLKLVEEAFIQFNITDPNEQRDISNTIKSQLNTSEAVTSVEESATASSAVYRANVRTAMIDIISHLLYIKDLEKRLNQLEGMSRAIINNAVVNLEKLQKSIIKAGGIMRESFTELVDHGTYKNTLVKEDKLRVNYADTPLEIKDISITVHPANSYYDGVVTTTSENSEVLLSTGIGSDAFKSTTTSNERPESYIDGSYFKGVKVEVTLETEPARVTAVSAKAGSSFRIAKWEGLHTDGWWKFGEDKTFGNYSYIKASLNDYYFSKHKLTLAFSDYVIKDEQYLYDCILYNIKLFQRDDIGREAGHFTSHLYPVDNSVFKVKFDTQHEGPASFRIKFKRNTEDFTHYVLPEGSNKVSYAFYYNQESTGSAGIKYYLPFHCVNKTLLKCQDPHGNDVLYDIFYDTDDERFPYIIVYGASIWGAQQGVTGNYSDFVRIEYEALKHRYIPYNESQPDQGEMTPGLSHYLNPDLHEALLIEPENIKDRYDRMDTFRFPLSSVPWRIKGETTFKFKKDDYTDNEIEVITPEEVFPVGGEVVFDDNSEQFYYYQGALYTNFDLLGLSDSLGGAGLLVEYPSMCSGIQVQINLYDDATVDNYQIELIEAPQPARKWELTQGSQADLTVDEHQGSGDTDGDIA